MFQHHKKRSQQSNSEERDPSETHKRQTPNDTVALMVGKWAMPTAVMLVMIACVAGLFLEIEKFISLVGMIAPLALGLIMLIKKIVAGNEER